MDLEEARRILSDDEKALISDEADITILARIKLMSLEDLMRFTKVLPKSEFCHDYVVREQKWMNDQQYYLGQKLGRVPTNREFVQELEKTQNHLRYRAFYVLKFPDRVEDIGLKKASA